ncbi:hypothetical protein BH23CHL5_BH23CHL5_26160 [soil metagenome]
MGTAEPLEHLMTDYLDHHQAHMRSAQTIAHYRDSFKHLGQYLAEASLPDSNRSLTTAMMRSFASWLRKTPKLLPRCGRTQRSVAGIHVILRDIRAFTR